MNNRKIISKEKLPLLVLSAIGFVFVFWFYGSILLHPNDIIFSDSGDGIKNYFTYAYHIKNDSTYTNLEGMNYPYGENYLYTDCHPILANGLKLLSKQFPYFQTHSIGILNLLMILSIFITFIIIYHLLVELKLNNWFSVIFSFCITILSPQLFRLSGHLALSYSVAIPLSWYLILKCINNSKKQVCFLLLINITFWMFIHAYLGIIICSFLICLFLTQILSDKDRKHQVSHYLRLGAAIILPVLLFYVHTLLTDFHAGRTHNPSGFFLYNAELDDILIPPGKPFRPLLDQLTGGIIKLKWEARGYLGMINALFFIALVFIVLFSFFNKKSRALRKTIFNNRLLNLSLIAASVVLLFALAIPFKQIPKLIEIIPLLKQFRATGRFVWPFYFVFTAFAAAFFQNQLITSFKKKRGRLYGGVFIVLFTSITLIEAFYYHKHVSQLISQNPNLFNKELLPEGFTAAIKHIDPNDYQAIISLPFYYYGSESFSRPRNSHSIRNSLLFSYHSNIPNICANLTRTSIAESKKIIQILSPNYYPKKIEKDFSNRKPFLIIKTGNTFTPYENAIIQKGETIHKSDQFELMQIRFEDLFSDDTPIAIKDYKKKSQNPIKQNSFYVSKINSVLYYNDFETTKSIIKFRGQGCYQSIKKGKNLFAEFPPNTFKKDTEYDVSMWMYNGEPDALNLWFRLIVEEYDESKDKWYSTTFFPEQAEVINNNWSLTEGVFRIKNPKNRIYIVSKGKDNSKAALHADDLLIKERNSEVYRIDKEDNTLFFNNHKIPLQ